jgi:hypothetical protein
MRYYLYQDGQTTGPHSLEALRQMASLQAVKADAHVAAEDANQWTPLSATPDLAASIFPEKTRFDLKPKQLTAIDNPIGEPPISTEDTLRDNLARQLPLEKPMVFEKRSNQRLRDYLFLVVVGNVPILPVAYFVPHPVVLMFALGYFVVYNAGIYWVLFHVMSRY